MPNPFDKYAKRAYSSVTKTMGDSALWIPSDGTNPDGITAKVLFNNPTKKKKLNEVDYDPYNWTMEYYKNSFPGLKESIDSGVIEVVTINETEYHVLKVNAKWDGDTSLAELQIKQ